MTNISNDFDCDIYVDADVERDNLGVFLTEQLGGSLVSNHRGGSLVGTITHDLALIEIHRNSDADPKRAVDFPGGFLFFPLRVEIAAVSGQEQALHEQLVPDALRALWSAGHAAVAACDYEDDLPEGGGTRSRSLPWPGRG